MKTLTTNPYVGLRPFEVDESILFFGRNEQTLELLQKLHENHFIAVVGSSGSGKSSLLRAGLIPALKAGYLVDDSDNWFIFIMKPGQNPLYNLVEAVLVELKHQSDSNSINTFVKQLKEVGAEVIIKLIEQSDNLKNASFFLLVDQFEELFRITMEQDDLAKNDEAIDFVNIILELAQQTAIPFYVVITMRSDFIGDCAQFFGLPESMNKSQYLVPRLNRVQLKAVIEGPAKLFGGKIEPTLTSCLINELGKVKDELPILQHVLMRMWEFETTVNKSGSFDLEVLQSIGGIEKALSNHADEALLKMSNEDKIIAKLIFQALTAIDDNNRKIRRPVLLSELKELTGSTEKHLMQIIDLFIRDRRSFVIANSVGNTGDMIFDISHESLIRQWNTLSHWVDEESESAFIYLQLAEAAKQNAQNKKDFLTGSELQLLLNWRDKFKPTAIWASRYKKGFDGCMNYLSASDTERTRLINIEKRKKRKLEHLSYAIMGLLLIIAVGGVSLWQLAKNKENDANRALGNLRAVQAIWLETELNSLESRAKIILGANGCPESIVIAMDRLLKEYEQIDSSTHILTQWEDKIKFIKYKSKYCK
ncbi:MAG: hypothetical protein IPO85_00050 [Saprospiraceae bacterium]|uniref:Novel STAND NTPase 1 domain-containing protein n=1 Tax=Candidatus Defluviibacterium haderslevense TaxID=2981993 RepID=A0A9D7XCV0_9BACT|nr:hypothetical protein [Candidatus Defluviibacterium haderslevense]